MRREQEDAEYPGIPLDSPERREMSVLVQSFSPDDLTGIILFFPSSRHEVLGRSPQVQFMSDFRGSVAAMEEWATRCEREGRINSAAIYLTGVARYRLDRGEIAAANETYSQALALRDRLPLSARATLGFAGYRLELCIAVNEGWAELFPAAGNLAGQRENLYVLASIQAGTALVLARLGRSEAALRMLATIRPALDRAPGWAPTYTQIACRAAATRGFTPG
jgi:hypothetical protein